VNFACTWVKSSDYCEIRKFKQKAVKISNTKNGRSCYVQFREIDKNYIDMLHDKCKKICEEEDHVIAISEYYRNILGLDPYDTEYLEITYCWLFSPIYSLLTVIYHPEIYARVLAKLSILALILAILPFFKSCCK
jgi:hypothetical protein